MRKKKNFGITGEVSLTVIVGLALVAIVLILLMPQIFSSGRSQADTVQQATDPRSLRDANCKIQGFLQGLDSDRDGVTDSCDRCIGANDKSGRGNGDEDGDGIPNLCDKFPLTSGDFDNDCINIIDEDSQMCGPTK